MCDEMLKVLAESEDPAPRKKKQKSTPLEDAMDLISSSDEEDNLDEVHLYLVKKKAPKEADPLMWWQMEGKSYPILQVLAQRYLAIPATSAPIECVWSTAGNTVTKKRASLDSDTVEDLVFSHENVHSYGYNKKIS